MKKNGFVLTVFTMMFMIVLFKEVSIGEVADSEQVKRLSGDQVVVDGSHYLIKSGTLILDFIIPEGYICFTQDREASRKEYESYETFYDAMIEYGWHMYIFDSLNGGSLQFTIEEGDFITRQIINLKELSEEKQMEYASAFAEVNNVELNEIIRSKNPWIRYANNNLETIVEGKKIRAVWFNNEYRENGVGIVDVKEIKLLLSGLQIYGSEE